MSHGVIPTPPTPLPATVIQRIVADLLYTLGEVKPANGYADTLIPTLPNPGMGNALQDGRVIVFIGDAEKQEPPLGYSQWLQHFHLVCEVVEPESSATSIQERQDRMRAQIEYALAGNAASWTRSLHEGSPLAEDTLLEGAVYGVVDSEAHDGEIQINIGVLYRTHLNNAFVSLYDT